MFDQDSDSHEDISPEVEPFPWIDVVKDEPLFFCAGGCGNNTQGECKKDQGNTSSCHAEIMQYIYI